MSTELETPVAPPKRRPGRPRSEVKRPMVSMRIDPDVLEKLRAMGPGWQTKVNSYLRTLMEQGRL